MSEPSKLAVIWSSADPEVAKTMVFMYSHNACKYSWWEYVTLVVWGPSARLLAENESLQRAVKKMQEDGVELLACKACSDMLKVSEKLRDLGIDVKYMGEPLTEMLKSEEWAILTF
jgi:hypothetical protein